MFTVHLQIVIKESQKNDIWNCFLLSMYFDSYKSFSTRSIQIKPIETILIAQFAKGLVVEDVKLLDYLFSRVLARKENVELGRLYFRVV